MLSIREISDVWPYYAAPRVKPNTGETSSLSGEDWNLSFTLDPQNNLCVIPKHSHVSYKVTEIVWQLGQQIG